MSKKICILNGSPRPQGNTKALIASFIKGAEAAGNETVCFDLQKMNIHGCLGCCSGGKDSAHPCVQRDDMEKIYPAYQEANSAVRSMKAWQEARDSGALQKAINQRMARERVLTLLNA